MAVSPDPPDKFKDIIPVVTSRTGGSFGMTLLSDAQHKAIDLYGLRNDEETADDGTILPFPATYVIDTAGKVRWKFTEKNQAVRPTKEAILAEVRKLW